ncbi:hypothetical protein DYJ33_29075, partial [Salmonella enterica]|nr:hypothetical protein [Salmonella enterica]
MNIVYSKILPAYAEGSLWSLSLLLISFFLIDIYLKYKKNIIFSKMVNAFSSYLEPRYLRYLTSLVSAQDNKWGVTRDNAIKALYKIKSILWIALGSNILDMLFCFIYFFVILLVGGWLVVVPFFVSVFFIVFVIFTAYSSENSNEISNS